MQRCIATRKRLLLPPTLPWRSSRSSEAARACYREEGDTRQALHLTAIVQKCVKDHDFRYSEEGDPSDPELSEGSAQGTEHRLFLNQYGEAISQRGIQKLVTKYARGAGIRKKAGVRSLRHTFATIKARQGVSPFRLRKWLGHARLDTTQIYVHMAEVDDKKVIEETSF